MIAKIFGVVLGVAKWFLLVVGALVVALVWWLSSGGERAQKEKADNLITAVEQPARVSAPAGDVVQNGECG